MPAAPARTDEIWAALADVPDPEIPSVSVIDLGIVHRIAFDGERRGARPERLRVEILPTFVGCPAVDAIRAAIADRLTGFADHVAVEVTFAVPWTSDRISADGRRKLRESGFAPPTTPAAPISASSGDLLPVLPSFTLGVVTCPYCGSRNTNLDNAFGPTLCRSIHYCRDCRQPFEQFKTV
ncbi:MAG: phenylacetate-CoA oxygenase subunit PaaJ [Chloroflexota bacterium]|nr:phenylacetate-CoA oxygenase subunit PaaJ [Chloroflexota bacterium]